MNKLDKFIGDENFVFCGYIVIIYTAELGVFIKITFMMNIGSKLL